MSQSVLIAPRYLEVCITVIILMLFIYSYYKVFIVHVMYPRFGQDITRFKYFHNVIYMILKYIEFTINYAIKTL